MKTLKNKHNCKRHPDEVSLSCANLLEEGTHCTCDLRVSVMDSFSGNLSFVNKNSLQENKLTLVDLDWFSYRRPLLVICAHTTRHKQTDLSIF